MKTYEEIENRRNELEELMSTDGCTKEIETEWKQLMDDEMAISMVNAHAIAQSGSEIVFIKSMYECGYAIHTKSNGEWDYDDGYTAVGAMKKFCELVRKFNIKACLVKPEWLDLKYLESIDEEDARYREEEQYAEACMASAYGDESLMNRYNRTHGIEKEYSPSNPWDAPGMGIRDFI